MKCGTKSLAGRADNASSSDGDRVGGAQFLALGAAETVVGLTDALKPMAERRGLYVPNAAVKSVARPGPINVLKFAAKA